MTLGEDTTVALRVAGVGAPLWLRVPAHVAERNHLAIGTALRVSLLTDALHVMPWRDGAQDPNP